MKLTHVEERRLIQRWQQRRDPKALAQLVSAFHGLIYRMARELRQWPDDLEDLAQEGRVGIIIAIDKFDLGRQTRLSTYAVHWIRALMMEHVMRNRRIVRLPSSLRRKFFVLSRARRALGQRGRSADRAALARTLQVSEREFDRLYGAAVARDLSLDAPISANDRGAVVDRLLDPAPGPEAQLILAEERARRGVRLRGALRRLDARERQIIRERWLGEELVPLRVLGKRLGISRERIRQIELRAKKKLYQSVVAMS